MPVATAEPTVNVAVELPLPGAMIEVGLNPTVTPVGMPVAESAIAELNPFSAAVETVEVFDAPCAALTASGAAVMVKSGAAVTVRFTVVLCVWPPPVPVIEIG